MDIDTPVAKNLANCATPHSSGEKEKKSFQICRIDYGITEQPKIAI